MRTQSQNGWVRIHGERRRRPSARAPSNSIQPKVSAKYVVMFEGQAVETERADGTVLLRKNRRDGDYLELKFRLYGERDSGRDQWMFQPTSVTLREKVHMRDRVLGIFQDGRFHELQPSSMLSPQCMICGKALVDPASMANMIGPECRGSASLNVRGLRDLMESSYPPPLYPPPNPKLVTG